jgi:hypothetical protein
MSMVLLGDLGGSPLSVLRRDDKGADASVGGNPLEPISLSPLEAYVGNCRVHCGQPM